MLEPVLRVKGRLAAAALILMGAVGTLATVGGAGSSAAPSPPPIHHVFVIMLENEEGSNTFGSPPPSPYLATTMRAEGAYLPNYYGIGHSSLDNYIAMISGQAPNTDTQNDCGTFADFGAPGVDVNGQETGLGCVYPPTIKTLPDQLTTAGLTWGGYEDSMGNNPARDNTDNGACGHPVLNTADGTEAQTAADAYATRHDPFMYFHSIIDDHATCDAHVVNLNALPAALASAATTPNYVFITPDLCDDGHDGTCLDGRPGGYAGINAFLSKWVPMITASPAYADGGLLITTFDEGVGDSTSCCGEVAGPGSPTPGSSGGTPGATGGGKVGAVLLSRYIAPGTVSTTPYNHYSMLASVEQFFGLTPLGYAAGTTTFGSDVFTQPTGSPPTVTSSTSTSTTMTATSTTSTAHVLPRCVIPKLPKARHHKLAAGALLRGAAVSHSGRHAFIQFTAVRPSSVVVRAKPRHGRPHRVASVTAAACAPFRYQLPSGHGTVTIRAAVSSGSATVSRRY